MLNSERNASHDSSWASSHTKREFYANRALKKLTWQRSRSRDYSCDDHFWSWPNVTLFKRPISTFFKRIKLRFIKIRALNFHFFWSWCVHDDLTTKKTTFWQKNFISRIFKALLTRKRYNVAIFSWNCQPESMYFGSQISKA